MIDFKTFEGLDIRVGTILKANYFLEAMKPAFQLQIDFGPLGTLNSSAQITKRYNKEDLVGKQVIAVVNLEAKRIANFKSQCLVLGAKNKDDIILLAPETELPNGQQIL